MKKKFLSLLLVFGLVLAFTANAYASDAIVYGHGEYDSFSLNPGQSSNDTFYDSDLDPGDDNMNVSVICNQSSANYILTLYDLTASKIIATKHFSTPAASWKVLDIDPNHDYKIEIYNSGSTLISGNMLTVIQ